MRSIEGVIIVGGGAVGLTIALSLAHRKVPVTVLEAEPDLIKEFRGSTFHPPTLEMLDELGVGESLIAQGVVAPMIQYRDRQTGMIAEFDMALLKNDTRYPFRLQIDQFALSALLLARLQLLPNTQINFGHKVTEVALTRECVLATVQTAAATQQLKATYLVGADGGDSIVRRTLGIEFQGMTYPNRYITVFTDFDFARYLPGLASVNYFSDPQEWVVMLRNPSVWRVLFPTLPEESDEEVLRDTALQARLNRIVAAASPYPLVSSRLYKVHQRVATTYRRGRALLAGDAAHVNNPLGGMGLNGGIHDAVSLSERMARVWHGQASDEELDTYAGQRRRIAIEYVQAQSHQNVVDMIESDPQARKRQHDNLARIAANPERAREHLLRASMIAGLQSASTA